MRNSENFEKFKRKPKIVKKNIKINRGNRDKKRAWLMETSN